MTGHAIPSRTVEGVCPVCGGDDGDNWFDRALCGCGSMHTRCLQCGYPLDGCELEPVDE